MQGTLNEIDIRSILQLIELGQRTGELYIEAVSGATWFVFFYSGRIIYGAPPDANLNRLQDYLRRYRVQPYPDRGETQTIAAVNVPEYGHLWALLEARLLTPSQARQIITEIIRETLFDLLSLHQGMFKFELASPLSPQLITLEIAPLVAEIMTQIQEWKQFYPHIQSPHQRLEIAQPAELRHQLPASICDSFDAWVEGQTSIRQLARLLGRDTVAIAKMIYPYVQQGFVQLVHTPPMASSSRGMEPRTVTSARNVPRIVCIDDSLAIRKSVEGILYQHGYEVSAIASPLKALGLVFQLKPDLILCDIAMPELDGYDFCAMLRSASMFRQIPIIMVTGKDGFIDRARAHLVGATDYLTKPFRDQELLMLIEHYVGLGDLNRPNPDQLLAEALKEELFFDSLESPSISSAFS